MVKCECGCGSELDFSIGRKFKRFIHGHNNYFKEGNTFGRANKGNNPKNKFKKGVQIWLGKKHTEKTKIKIGIANSGENHGNWKGGITSLNDILRNNSKMKIWRELVFLRNNFTCQNPNCFYCNNKRGGILLHPHHIKPLSLFPELAFDINNGITYCAEFHLKSGLHKNIKNRVGVIWQHK